MDSGGRAALPRTDRLVMVLAAGLVMATLMNGALPFLKRIGVLDRQSYDAYWNIHCAAGRSVSGPAGIGRHCIALRYPDLTQEDVIQIEAPYRLYLYQVSRRELWLKLSKDALFVTLLAISLVQVIRGWPTVASRHAWPVWALTGVIVVTAANGLLHEHVVELTAGIRAFALIGIALLCGWLVREHDMRIWACVVAVLLCAQAALLPVEFLWGLPIYGQWGVLLPKRLIASLVLPNTLGVFAACGAGFVIAYNASRRAHAYAWGAAVLLVAASGSATGAVALILLASYRSMERTRRPYVVALVAVVILALLAVVLPTISGRTDIYNSLIGEGGRVEILRQALAVPPLQLIAGRGLGIGTNASLNLPVAYRSTTETAADSTVTFLIRQIGIIGAILFYAAVLRAWQTDRQGRPFHLVVLVTSLTTVLFETFPVNLLLGLCLARVSARSLRAEPQQ